METMNFSELQAEFEKNMVKFMVQNRVEFAYKKTADYIEKYYNRILAIACQYDDFLDDAIYSIRKVQYQIKTLKKLKGITTFQVLDLLDLPYTRQNIQSNNIKIPIQVSELEEFKEFEVNDTFKQDSTENFICLKVEFQDYFNSLPKQTRLRVIENIRLVQDAKGYDNFIANDSTIKFFYRLIRNFDGSKEFNNSSKVKVLLKNRILKIAELLEI